MYILSWKIHIVLTLFLCFCLTILRAEKTLTILQSSDIHARLDFYPHMGAVLRNIPENERIYIDCGDTIQGSFAAAQAKGKDFLLPLKLLQCDVFVPGNHDFDFGVPTLARECTAFPGTVVAGNVSARALPVKPYVMLHKNGLSIAVIGMTDETLFSRFLFSQEDTPEFHETTTTLEKILALPEIHSANLIIFARHNGVHTRGRNLYEFLPAYPAINLVLCGHTHEELPGIRIGNALIVQPPAEGTGYAEIRAVFADDGTLLELQSRLVYFSPQSPTDPTLRAAVKQLYEPPNAHDLRRLPPPRNDTSFVRVIAEETAKIIRDAADADLAWYAFSTAQESFPAVLDPEQFFSIMPYEETVIEIAVTKEELRQLWDEILAKKPPHLTVGASSEMPLRRNTAKALGDYPLPVPARPDGKYLVAISDHLAAGGGSEMPFLRQIVKERGRILQFYDGTVPLIRDLVWNSLPSMPHSFQGKK